MTKLIGYNKMKEEVVGNTNPYTNYELIGREIANNILKELPDIENILYVSLRDAYNTVDGMFTSGGTNFVFELKHRPTMHSDNQEYWLDENKVLKIKKFKELYPNYEYLYITTTKDGKLFAWDINMHNENIHSTVVQKTQTSQERVEKRFYSYNKNKTIIAI